MKSCSAGWLKIEIFRIIKSVFFLTTEHSSDIIYKHCAMVA